MKEREFKGEFLNAFLSDTLFEENPEKYSLLEEKIKVLDNEAAYVYSFKESKLLFVKGFDKLLGIKNSDLNIKKIHSLWDEKTSVFFNEFIDKAFHYLYSNNNGIETVEFNSIVNLKKISTPIHHNFRVFETDDNGNLISIIVRIKTNKNLKIGEIIQYSILGGDIYEKPLKETKYNLVYKKCISKSEVEMIESFVDSGKSKEIFSKIKLNPEEFIIVLENLITRFGLETREELIQFAKENYLIPNQFNLYLNQ